MILQSILRDGIFRSVILIVAITRLHYRFCRRVYSQLLPSRDNNICQGIIRYLDTHVSTPSGLIPALDAGQRRFITPKRYRTLRACYESFARALD